MTVIKKIMPFIILLGVLSFVLASPIFGYDNNLIHLTTTNGIKYYTFDLRTYLDRIQNIWTSHAPTFDQVGLRTDIKIIPNNVANVIEWLKLWGHNWAVTISWIMLPLSILTWIGNWIIFLAQMILALIGMPDNATIFQFLNFLKSLANIPTEVINALSNL